LDSNHGHDEGVQGGYTCNNSAVPTPAASCQPLHPVRRRRRRGGTWNARVCCSDNRESRQSGLCALARARRLPSRARARRHLSLQRRKARRAFLLAVQCLLDLALVPARLISGIETVQQKPRVRQPRRASASQSFFRCCGGNRQAY
jgi:hypothetical protein